MRRLVRTCRDLPKHGRQEDTSEADGRVHVVTPLRLAQYPVFVHQALPKFDQHEPCVAAGPMVIAEEVDVAVNRSLRRRLADGSAWAFAHKAERMVADQNEISARGEQARGFPVKGV